MELIKKHIGPLLEAEETLVTKRSPKKVKSSKVLSFCVLIVFSLSGQIRTTAI